MVRICKWRYCTTGRELGGGGKKNKVNKGTSVRYTSRFSDNLC